MHLFGLKIWSINKNYVNDVVKIISDGICSYLEIYSVPDSYETSIIYWDGLTKKDGGPIPFLIHAPHFGNGVNLAREECWQNNSRLALEAFRFADSLHSDSVIFHPGVDGKIEETARQIKKLSDDRILIENKPFYSTDGRYVCNGHSPEEISFLMEETGIGFCLDIGHCICSANAKKIDPLKYIREFISLKPTLFHLTDGDFKAVYDRHNRYGKGNFPLKEILDLIPEGSRITNESEKSSPDNLNDVVVDLSYLNKIIQG